MLSSVKGTSENVTRPHIPCLFIEGAIGIGKTTFVRMLKSHLPHVEAVFEPTDAFTNVKGTGNILDLFFNDQKRWAFTTEIYASLVHAQAIEEVAKKTTASTLLIDRCSMYADRYVFGKMAFHSGTMSALEWEVYKQQINWITHHTTHKPRGFIYLRSTPHVALQRVRVRNRVGEKSLSMQFQESLCKYYEDWFIEKKDIPEEIAKIPVLIIDADQNFKDDSLVQQACVNHVKEFIEKYGSA